MTKAQPRPGEAGNGAVTAGSGQASGPAVVAIALGSFALVFSELIPVGLLADISGHLRASIGTGGLMVVVPAGSAGRRDRWSREHRIMTTLKLPSAALPAAAGKELPCPTTRKELLCPTPL